MNDAATAERGKEKRRFPRFDIAIPVILRRKAGDLNLHTVDVSRHGAFVRIDPPPPLRQLVQLRFRVPDLGDVDAMCMVARSLGKDHPRGPGIGVDFFALSKDAKAIWERFISLAKQHAPAHDATPMAGVATLASPATGNGDVPIVEGRPLFPTAPPALVVQPVIAVPTPFIPPAPAHASGNVVLAPPPAAMPRLPARPVAEAPPAWLAPNSLTAGAEVAPAGMPFPAMGPEVFQPPPAPPVMPQPARGPVTTMMQAVALVPATQQLSAPVATTPPAPVNAHSSTLPPTVLPQPASELPSGPMQIVEVPVPKAGGPPPPPSDEDVIALDDDEAAVVMLRVPDREALKSFVERDIARGGMFLKTPLVKDVGEKVEIVVVHPETDEELHLEGTVVRRVITGPPEQRGLGIFFRSLTPEKEEQLKDFIEGGIEVVELGTPISQAQLDLEQAVAKEPDSPEALEALGVYLLDEEGDLGGALTALTRALVLGPSVVSIHASLARAYRKIGDSVKVRAHERVAESLMLMQERMKVRLGVGEE